MSNLDDLVNKAARKEIDSLKKTVLRQRRVILKQNAIFTSIKIEAQKGIDLWASINEVEHPCLAIPTTPDLQAQKSVPGTLEK